jgi:SAM-dependent methyltransferase
VSDSLSEHLGYVGDSKRTERYVSAIRSLIGPESIVLDLGCGSGILGFFCLKAGAAHVFAIDSTAMIDVARDTFARAGMSNRVSFIRELSVRAHLSKPVDIIICDQVGYFGFDYGIVHTLQDARRRFLKPTGRLIPARIRLHLAAIESESCYKDVDGWQAEGVPIEFRWLRARAVNAKYAVELPETELLGAPVVLGDIDLHADNPDFLSWTATLSIARDGVMHGLVGWFEAELADGVWMTNSPLSDQAIRRPQAFLPIDEAVAVKTGDSINAKVMTRPADNLIAWVVEFPASGKRYSHSTWQQMPLSRDDLTRSRPDRVPRVSRYGKARSIVLRYCDGRRTAGEIEATVLRDHPHLFPSKEEISRFVTHVLARDTE